MSSSPDLPMTAQRRHEGFMEQDINHPGPLPLPHLTEGLSFLG